MRNEDMPVAVRQYVTAMRFLGVLYALAGIVFFFFPRFVFALLNLIPSILTPMAALPESSEYFWLPLAASMMGMLTFLCFAAAAAPENRTYAWVHFLSKVISSAGYLYYLVNHAVEGKYVFAYLLGILTDAPIALFVFYITARASFALSRGAAARPRAREELQPAEPPASTASGGAGDRPE